MNAEKETFEMAVRPEQFELTPAGSASLVFGLMARLRGFIRVGADGEEQEQTVQLGVYYRDADLMRERIETAIKQGEPVKIEGEWVCVGGGPRLRMVRWAGLYADQDKIIDLFEQSRG